MDHTIATLQAFHLAISGGLMTLIWLVQLIAYPGLHQIPAKGFVAYHRLYVHRITWVVAPMMIGEAALTIRWFMSAPGFASMASAVCVLVVWLSTFLLQVPIHSRLTSGKQRRLIRRLVATNWIRTIAWSLKTFVLTMATIGSPF